MMFGFRNETAPVYIVPSDFRELEAIKVTIDDFRYHGHQMTVSRVFILY